MRGVWLVLALSFVACASGQPVSERWDGTGAWDGTWGRPLPGPGCAAWGRGLALGSGGARCRLAGERCLTRLIPFFGVPASQKAAFRLNEPTRQRHGAGGGFWASPWLLRGCLEGRGHAGDTVAASGQILGKEELEVSV